MERYNPPKIEKKWQAVWEKEGTYKTSETLTGKKYYCLVMFPYSSGDLHIGHWYNFAPADIHARYKRMSGYNVLHPMGFDSFGLPAENAAIKRKIHPHDWTEQNIERMTTQLKSTGNSYDWGRVLAASRPEYYKWTQWLFLLMYKRNLAYKAKALANWCPSCQTVLANEQVESGKCWRCASEVEQRNIDQWMFRITDYADRLLTDLSKLDWPGQTIAMQRHWIGKSEGIEIDFPVVSSHSGAEQSEAIESDERNHSGNKTLQDDALRLRVFTTRADTVYGVTFMVLAPEHPFIDVILNSFQNLKIPKQVRDAVAQYTEKAKKKLELERKQEEKDRSGVFTGAYALNPLSNERIPIYVSDYVLMGYGTGAIMGVPGHDARDNAFAKKHDLPIKVVVRPLSRSGEATTSLESNKKDAIASLQHDEINLFTDYGMVINSGEYSGKTSEDVIQKIKEYINENQLGEQKVNYHLRDWVVSRQRYWGAPIPIINCERCGVVPVNESDLPVLLPFDVDYTPKGTSPLGTSYEFLNTGCPQCNGPAKRETDTMDTFVDSSWYFLRFTEPWLKAKAFSEEKVKYWLPVDMYIGGAEHTVLHLLYSRFVTKVLFDAALINFEEPFKALRHQGTILGPDGNKMSKSKGNVINPDDLLETYGSDTVRLYLSFMGPYDHGGPWNNKGMEGMYRFLGRVWSLTQLYLSSHPVEAPTSIGSKGRDSISESIPSRIEGLQNDTDKEDLRQLHKTIKKISEDIDILHFNTAVASLMEWCNFLQSKKQITQQEQETFLLLLAPFAPHMTEELWQLLGRRTSIHLEKWPEYKEEFIKSSEVTLVIQVDGKVRDRLVIETGLPREKALEAAQSLVSIRKHLSGKAVGNVVFVPDKLINFVTKG